ncbi:hypothetical protein [Phenylobacterium sp. 58.2.17]|uniref:hypothetical protein n=1 Tax=Phenylobacterium sp. 58.2.17 TaxID=2969306 RepID=UPI0022643991|nr:hypothetical protein [Phenylobacterium sp. 58.2.17]MCX7585056.1 hypothetical protein [Phenylobacterium sp. 58.2.17]
MVELNTTKAAIDQIEKCGFECEGGPLSNNVGWRWLKAHLDGGPLYCLGQSVNYTVAGEVSGVKISQVVKLCVVGISMSSSSERRTWTYALSTDPPSAYHYGSGVQFLGVPEESLTPFSPSHEHGAAK